MPWWHRRYPRRMALQYLVALVVTSALYLLVLPVDHTLKLALRFGAYKVLSCFPSLCNSDDWSSKAPRYPVDLTADVATILKTGYGTWRRLPAQLEALGLTLNGTADGFLVVADFSSHFRLDGQDFWVHDMLAAAEDHIGLQAVAQHDGRFAVHDKLVGAIRGGRPETALEISKSSGWELDAVKFMPALHRAWKMFPGRKWYLMLDDDTFVIWPTLQLLLGHLDAAKPMYLGNAVGDFRTRFAHGGSGIVISGEAMRRLFEERPDVVRAAYVESLTETWGDRLVAKALARTGVFLDERYSRLFNGERPRTSRITAERFCAPLVSFHSLAQPGQMLEAGRMFGDRAVPVFWHQLWKLYDQPSWGGEGGSDGEHNREEVNAGYEQKAEITTQEAVALEGAVDRVGRLDERTKTRKKVRSAEECDGLCQGSRTCLAWSWEESSGACHLAPWFLVGGEQGSRQQRTGSGLNIGRVRELQRGCNSAHPHPTEGGG